MVPPLLESVNRRRTDNTMAKRKMTKGQPTIYKTLHEKLIIEQHEPHQNMFLMALRNSYYYNKLTFLLYAHLFFLC